MKSKKVSIPVGKEQVSGIVSIPDKFESGILIAHGAGNDMNNPLIVHFSEGLAAAGYVTLRFNFPYREKGRKAPDSQNKLIEAWQSVHDFFTDNYSPSKITAAGKSMGGRVASQMVSEGTLAADRLIFLGYPLHPPGNKNKMRDSHLYEVDIPMLFFAGTRDSLCDLELLKNVLDRLKVPWDLEIIEGGDHSFNIPISSNLTQLEVYGQVLKKTIAWLESINP